MLWIWSLIFNEEKALSLFLKVGKAQNFDESFFFNWFSLVEHMLLNQTNLSSKWPYVTDTNWCFVFCVLVVTMRRFVLHDGSFYCEICQSLWKCQPVAKKLEFESSTLKNSLCYFCHSVQLHELCLFLCEQVCAGKRALISVKST